jgi:putative ATPase
VGHFALTLDPAAQAHIIQFSDGDALMALNALEEAAKIAGKGGVITLEIVEQAFQQRALRYDKDGDQHYDIISAFIKSMRGSDPDAALYWMARMLEAGEDPLFVARRMLIFASEDVGNADPRALLVAQAADASFRRMGMPEGIHPLAQACTYLATAPKSNASIAAYQAAAEDAKTHGALDVPKHLRPGTAVTRAEGWGEGYRYSHAEEGSYAAGQQYLPDSLVDRSYYQPKGAGYEAQIAARMQEWAKRRAAAKEKK